MGGFVTMAENFSNDLDCLTKLLREHGYKRPMDSTPRKQLMLDNGVQVQPWVLDKDLVLPKKLSQENMRVLWYSDRGTKANKLKGEQR